MTNKEFKDNIIEFTYMDIKDLNNLDGEYLELWNKFSDESKQLIKHRSIMLDSLISCKILYEKINAKYSLYDLYEDDETGNLYDEDDEIILSMDDYWEINAENMVNIIYDYELKRGIKL